MCMTEKQCKAEHLNTVQVLYLNYICIIQIVDDTISVNQQNCFSSSVKYEAIDPEGDKLSLA